MCEIEKRCDKYSVIAEPMDVAEVVRCKYCKFKIERCSWDDDIIRKCTRTGLEIKDHDYCSYGIPRGAEV